MEPMASILDKLKAFAKSGEDFFAGLTRRENRARRNPIEILKRLQREAFADLMKQRDRLDKVEKLLTFYGSSKGGPFRGDGTRVGGEVDLMGTLFLKDYLDQENVDAIKRSGIKTGVCARINFETKVREKDVLEAEFISSLSGHTESGKSLGTALSFARVSYIANMTDWFSIAAIPMGARCRDEKGLTDYSSFGPPLLHENHGGSIGITVKKSDIVASLAQFVVDLPSSFGHCFSTFGQIVYQFPRSTRLSLFGVYQAIKSRQQANLGPLTMPLGIFRCHKHPQTSVETSSPMETSSEANVPAGSVAMMLESELDERTRVQGWVQMKNTNPRHLQWAVSMSDFPEEDIGWALSLGGSMQQHPASWDHFQVEAFLKFNLGRRFSLQPGFVYLMDRGNQMPVLMLRSTWSL
ncbi:hypothetical protein Cgig2_029065 [Carnegiea gigantea]|uniref:Uncharacterized protein n=1 Tax=Carnegiea gigantea TaxID=171969 RepID=A0A9Q1KAA8_9CARY|nr:hypothetical protein Cgig2_029065 [Carnegiea gigantea]